MADQERAGIDEDEELIINDNDQGEEESEHLSDYDVEEIVGGVLSTFAQTEVGIESRNVRKRPRSAWMVFLSEFIRKEKDATPSELSFNMTATAKLASDRWSSMSKEDKASYEEIAEKDRAECHAVHPPKRRSKTAKAVIITRCSPTSFRKVIKKFTPDQIVAVKNLGFGGLLDLKCTLVCRGLCKWLVEHFDTAHCCLNLGNGQVYPISPDDVELVMGLPATGDDVPTVGSSDEVNRIRQEYNATKTGVPYSVLVSDLRSGDSGDRFCRSFVLYALGILLCPTLKMESSPKLFPAVVEVAKICSYNWAKFVLDWLVKEVKGFRASFSVPNTARGRKKMKSKSPKSGLGGCLLFLMLFYFDRAAPAIANVPRETPRLKGWTDELIRSREAEVKSFYADNDEKKTACVLCGHHSLWD